MMADGTASQQSGLKSHKEENIQIEKKEICVHYIEECAWWQC